MSENNMRLLTAFRLEAVNSKTVHDGKYVLYDWAKGDFLTWAQIAAAARSLIPATRGNSRYAADTVLSIAWRYVRSRSRGNQ